MLLEDAYPPFGDEPYPASVDVIDPAGPRDRVSVAFRLILAIPHFIVLAFVMLGVVHHHDRGVVPDSVHRRVPGGPVRVRRGLAPLAHSPAGVPPAARRRIPAVFACEMTIRSRSFHARPGRAERLRDGARRARGRTQTQSLDLVRLSAARWPGAVLRMRSSTDCRAPTKPPPTFAIACCAIACFASRTRCSRNSARSGAGAGRRHGLGIDAHEARLVDDALPRGRAADRRSGHRDARRRDPAGGEKSGLSRVRVHVEGVFAADVASACSSADLQACCRARSSSSSRSRALRVSDAARSNSARASSQPAKLHQQIAAHARQEMIAAHRGLAEEPVHQIQSGLRTVCHADGHRAIQLHDR